MHGVLHLVVQVIGKPWIDEQHAPDFVEAVVGHGLEEVVDLLLCLVALVDHAVVALVVQLAVDLYVG